MSRPQVKIVDATSGQEIVRDATDSEIAQMELDAADAIKRKQAKAEAEANRQALLDKLGITEEEAKILLG